MSIDSLRNRLTVVDKTPIACHNLTNDREPDMIGIYGIHGPKGRVYVGRTSRDIVHRMVKEHRRPLEDGKHPNRKLQAAWNKYQPADFLFIPLEIVDNEADLVEREQFWIDTLDAYETGYNLTPRADGMRDFKHSDETRKLLRELNRGRKSTPQSRARVSAAQMGMKRRPGTGAKISAALKGRKEDPTATAKRAEKLRQGDVGERFGSLVAVAFVDTFKGRARWQYACDCGQTTTKFRSNVKASPHASCGCGTKSLMSQKATGNTGRRKDYSGVVFGSLTAIKFFETTRNHTIWSFQCVCGKTCRKSISAVRQSPHASCGCNTHKKGV